MKTITLQIDHNKYSEIIEIKDTQTLADLAIKILATYCYSNNHSHAFFLDNTYWGIEDCIFSDGLDLIAENQRLKTELEYLKKLSALVLAEEQEKNKKQ